MKQFKDSDKYLFINRNSFVSLLCYSFFILYVISSIYLFFKIIPDLTTSISVMDVSVNERINNINSLILETNKLQNDKIEKLIELNKLQGERISEIEKSKEIMSNINELGINDQEGLIKKMYVSLSKLPLGKIIGFVCVSSLCLVGYTWYNNLDLPRFIINSTYDILYYLKIYNKTTTLILRDPLISDYLVKVLLKNNNTVLDDVFVSHVSSTKYTPILDYLKSISELSKKTDNSEIVNIKKTLDSIF